MMDASKRDRPVYIVVNGILTSPGHADEWTDRAVTWFHNDASVDVHAEKFEYFATALTRRLRQRSHALALGALIRRYAGRPIYLVGHSNGCDLIARALRETSVEVRAIHLIAAAVEENFDRNGFNEALARGQLGTVHVYGSANDAVLKWLARPSRWIFGVFGLGYGLLGLLGPVAAYPAHRVFMHWKHEFGHGTWFSGEHFAETLSDILKNDRHE